MFDVDSDEWEYEPEPSTQNPKGIPERTITGFRLLEAGPVTWPANPSADVQVNSQRSGTDWLYKRLEAAGTLGDTKELRSRLSAKVAGKHRAASVGVRQRLLREMELA